MPLVFKKNSMQLLAPSKLKVPASMTKTVSIKLLLHQRLHGWETARDHATIHASELMKPLEFCPREFALLDLTNRKGKDQFIGTAMAVTFRHGRNVEKAIRDEWLRDIAVGYWKCGVCQYLNVDGQSRPLFGKAPKIKCPKCGWGHQWQYEEVRFKSSDSGISGGIDVLLDVGAPKLMLTEIKTLDKDEFKALKAPLAEHRFRTSLYLRLTEESMLLEAAKVNIREARLLYVSKSYGFKDETIREAGIKDSGISPFKEFTIKRDDTLSETPIAKASALNNFRKNPSAGTPCGICVNGLTKRAQQCSAIAACFSGKFPASITWLENGKPRHPDKKLTQ